jgi:hypothetical protein
MRGSSVVACIALSFCVAAPGARDAAAQGVDPWKPLAFLDGTWAATVQGGAVTAVGRYTFRRELAGHVLARHGVSYAGCKGPKDFDCAHGDLLYVFEEASGQPLKAIYFDNEGHVLHYAITVPAPNEVVFLSEPAPGPAFRLVYKLEGAVMSGKFQVLPPGQSEWRSYLEWRGGHASPAVNR